jgi:tRNA(fMet)-specific endonuclease VapC
VTNVLLDTTVLIDLSKQQELVFPTLQALIRVGATVGVCAISLAEFFAGVPPVEQEYWRERLADFVYWDITQEAATLAGMLRYDYARQGVAIQITDALMAATAMTIDATLATNNVKDFPMTGLRLVQLGNRG